MRKKVQIVGLIITLLILIWFWTWFLNQIFSRLSEENVSKWEMLAWGGILVFLLFIYEKILVAFGLDRSLFFIRESFNLGSVGSFLGYGLLVVIGLTLIFKQFKNKKIWLQIFVAFLSLIVLTILGGGLGLSTLVLYYVLAASIEEILKFTLGNNQSESAKKIGPSTLLLFSLLIGFSFSIAENGLAFMLQMINGSMITAGMLVGRGLLASLIHIVATGTIALTMIKCKKIGLLGRYSLALLIGFTIHIGYNLSFQLGMFFISVLLAVGASIVLSYLIFHLDEIYE